MEVNNNQKNFFAEYMQLVSTGMMAGGLDNAAGMDAATIQKRLVKLSELLNASLTLGKAAPANGKDHAPCTSAPDVFGDVDDINITTNDIECILAKLQAMTDDKVLVTLKKNMEKQLASLKNNYNKSMEKIEKAVADAKKSEAAARRRRRWGIFGAILSIFAAVVVTICTGGVAAGFAIAGAVLAVGSLVMQETGLTKKITDKIAASLQKKHPEWSKAKCEAVAGGILGGIFLALNIVCMVGGFASAGAQMKNMADTVKKAVQIARMIQSVLNGVNTGASLATSIESIIVNKRAGDSAAEVTEMQAYLLMIKKLIEESSDDIQKLMDALSNDFGKLLAFLNERVKNQNDVLQMTAKMV